MCANVQFTTEARRSAKISRIAKIAEIENQPLNAATNYRLQPLR
jgi:hypothetical protein